jgi:hypothetical protein
MVAANLFLPFVQNVFFVIRNWTNNQSIVRSIQLAGFTCTLLLQLVSTVFLTVSLVKIKKAVSAKIGVELQLKQLFLHQVSFYLYLLALVLYDGFLYYSLFVKEIIFPLVLREVRLALSVISQAVIIYILNQVCDKIIE